MKSIIIGTAGHIDHGKTALVKALTGIDADRLEEEKRRGITIDLGFAHMELPGPNGETLRIGFVDVPGHERFVRNMLAGVGGMDLVLLVIAADESIKPQTREHSDILQLIGVQRGITVLTKSDVVDPETLNVVKLEVEDFLRGTFLEQSPIVAVSSLTGSGLDVLKRAIVSATAELTPRDPAALMRLPIDRVFTMKGFGTVVTGTLISGTIRAEEELQVLPGGQTVRVRGVQVHGHRADSAVAGQRTALNLAGVAREDLARGMILAPASTFATTRNIDVLLKLLPSAGRPLRDRTRVHFHSHTMETVAEIVFQRSDALNATLAKVAGTRQLAPGSQAFARIRFPDSALLLPGDRFIIRRFSPVVTIGGGIVLDASPIPGFKQVTVDALLRHAAAGDSEQMLVTRVARRWFQGLTIAEAVRETGWRAPTIESHLKTPLTQGTVLRLADLLIYSPAMNALRELLSAELSAFHQKNPLVPGMGKEQLREKFTLRAPVFSAALDSLTRDKTIEISGDLVRLRGHGVVMKDEEAESKKTIESAFATAGLKVPSLPEVLAGLKIDKVRAQRIVTLLLRDKVLIKVAEGLVFYHAALAGLRTQMARQKSKDPKISVAAFKELTGVSRKYAIPLLEYLDRERVTRRVGDVREIL